MIREALLNLSKYQMTRLTSKSQKKQDIILNLILRKKR